MRIRKLKLLGEFNWSLLIGGICLTVRILFLMAQKSNTQNISDENRQKQIAKKMKEQKQMFYKISSTENPVDEGNRIVAVRRIKLKFEDIDSKGFPFTNQKDLIEIEVFSSVTIPGTNARQYLVIGDKAFSRTPRSADGHTVFVHLTPAEFDNIKDDSIVSLVISGGALTDNSLAESYRNGEPSRIPGAKFGRFKKSMLNEFQMLEEDAKTQSSRITNTRNEIQ